MNNNVPLNIENVPINPEESMASAHGFGQFGINSFIRTAHIMSNYYDNNPKHIKIAMIQNTIETFCLWLNRQVARTNRPKNYVQVPTQLI